MIVHYYEHYEPLYSRFYFSIYSRVSDVIVTIVPEIWVYFHLFQTDFTPKGIGVTVHLFPS